MTGVQTCALPIIRAGFNTGLYKPKGEIAQPYVETKIGLGMPFGRGHIYVLYRFISGNNEPDEQTYQNKILSKDGKEFILTWSTSVLKENNKITGVLGSALDITELSNIQKELKEELHEDIKRLISQITFIISISFSLTPKLLPNS
mgnify:CR=1 FL=1